MEEEIKKKVKKKHKNKKRIFFALLIILFGIIFTYALTLNIKVSDSVSSSNNITIENNFSYLSIGDSTIGFVNSSNLLIYMPFDVNINNKFDYDYTNNNLNGLGSIGVIYDGGFFGNASKYYDNASISLPKSNVWNISNSRITISAWVYKDDLDSGNDMIFGGGGTTVARGEITFGILQSNGMRFGLKTTGGTNADNCLGNVMPNRNWTFVAGTYNGTTMVVYVNNNSLSCTRTGDISFTNSTFTIGGFRTTTGTNLSYFNGTIDDFMILNYSLTPTEVASLYANQSSRFFPRGEQIFPNINISSTGKEYLLNITINSITPFNSSIKVAIGEANATAYNYGSELSFNNDLLNDTWLNNPNNISLKFIFYAGNSSSNSFISPNLIGNISLNSWTIPLGNLRSIYVLSTDNSTQVVENMGVNITNSTGKQVNVTYTNVTGGAFLTFNQTDYYYNISVFRSGWVTTNYRYLVTSNITLNDQHQWSDSLIVSSNLNLNSFYSAYISSILPTSGAINNLSDLNRPCRYSFHESIYITSIGKLNLEGCTIEINDSLVQGRYILSNNGTLIGNYSNFTKTGTSTYQFINYKNTNFTLINSFISDVYSYLEIYSSNLVFYNNTIKDELLLDSNLNLSNSTIVGTGDTSYPLRINGDNVTIRNFNISGVGRDIDVLGANFVLIDSNFTNFQLNKYLYLEGGYMNTIWFINITSGENVTCTYSGSITNAYPCYIPGNTILNYNGSISNITSNSTNSTFDINSNSLNLSINNIIQDSNITIKTRTLGKPTSLDSSSISLVDASNINVSNTDASNGGDITLINSNVTIIKSIGGSVTSGNGNGGNGGKITIQNSDINLTGNISVERGTGSGTGVRGNVGRLVINFSNSFNDLGADYKGNLTLSIENANYGRIDWLNELNGDDLANISTSFNITDNGIEVFSDTFAYLNKSANITLYNMNRGLKNPQIFKDGELCTDCYNFTSLSADVVVFNTSSFSSFSIADGGGISIGLCTTNTTILSYAPNLDAGNNMIISFIQFRSGSTVTSKNILAGNLRLRTSANVILDNNLFTLGLGTTNTQRSFVFITNHSNAPANEVYNITACASTSGFAGEAKMLVLNNLTNVAYNKTLFNFSSSKANVSSITTNFTSGNSIVLASINILNRNLAFGNNFNVSLFTKNGTLIDRTYENYLLGATSPTNMQNILLMGIEENATVNSSYYILVQNNTGTLNVSVQVEFMVMKIINGIQNYTNTTNIPTKLTNFSTLTNVNISKRTIILASGDFKDKDINTELMTTFRIKKNDIILNSSQYSITTFTSTGSATDTTQGNVMSEDSTLSNVPANFTIEEQLASTLWAGKFKLLAFSLENDQIITNTCTYSTGNWAITCSDNCIINSNVVIDANSNLSIIGFGNVIFNANVTGFKDYLVKGTSSSQICNVIFRNGARLR